MTELEAGPELDALIAEKVMGISGQFCPHITATIMNTPKYDPRYLHAVDGCCLPCAPPYSTDIAAAWQVVEAMLKRGFDFSVSSRIESEVWWSVVFDEAGVPENHYADGYSVPVLICRAALKAVS